MIEKFPLLFLPLRQSLSILIFHRVLPAIDLLRPGEPDAARFERMMRFVAANFLALPLAEAVDRLQNGTLPRRACSITFDDGYADNLTIALPILEKYRLPGTVFVATDYLNGGRMFNDAVIDAISLTRKDTLDLNVIDLGVLPLRTIENRREAIGIILNRIKFSPPTIRDRQLIEVLKAADCGSLSKDIMLTSCQLKELARRGIEIGGHTMAHTILTTTDDDQAIKEICEGKKTLEALIGEPITSFAYPNGKPERDYALRHAQMVKLAGFRRAVTTAPGVSTRDTDVFQLPRFTPWASHTTKASIQLTRNAWSRSSR